MTVRSEIRRARPDESIAVAALIEEAAAVYRGVIPSDCWHEPYMPVDELVREVDDGVRFWVLEQSGRVVAVMGLQRVRDVALIRHAYVLPAQQGRGHGSALLARLRELTEQPMLVGTWRAAVWAVRFYRHRGFSLLDPLDAGPLLRSYWSVPARQRKASVVLADARWTALHRGI